MKVALWSLIPASALLTACLLVPSEPPASFDPNRTDEASDLVSAWLDEIASNEGDRGWSRLASVTQESVFGGSRDAYLIALGTRPISIEWAMGAVHVIDDRFEVEVELPKGLSDLPPILTSEPFVQIIRPSSSHGVIFVAQDASGKLGILAYG